MKLSAMLKKWIVGNCGVKANATDDDFRKAAAEAMAKSDGEEGYLSIEKYTELSTTQEDKDAEKTSSLLKDMAAALASVTETVAEMKKAPEVKAPETVPEVKAPETVPEVKETPAPTKHVPTAMEKMITQIGGQSTMGVGDDEEKGFSVRVKEAAESYTDTKSTMTYPSLNEKGASHVNAGRPVIDFTSSTKGRVLKTASELDQAVGGAFSKFMCLTAQKNGSRSMAFHSLPQHDKELLCYAMENMKWGGSTTGADHADIKDRKLNALEQKALIDDATSGGLEAAPISFDDQVISAPLLHGELFPYVNVVPIPRGRRIEGVITGNVTASWGGVDDTAIALFNTAAYVSAFDTTIFRWEGAIQIGLDFLTDTPIDFNSHITAQYGERLLEDLDDVIATGNGTTQPEGAMNKTGSTSVAWGGATSIGNYESLRFAVAKPELKSNLKPSAVFCGTETSYQRVRALPVGASDARRLFGMDHFDSDAGGYVFGGAKYKINESLANTQVFYAILGRYRMYRRKGFTMRTSTEGDTLIRNNALLMVAMSRWGGQFERGAVVGITTTAPA